MHKITMAGVLLLPAILLGHGGEDHSKKTVAQLAPEQQKQEIYQKINKAYSTTVKPIFQAKCFACHAQKPKEMPWYYSLPGAKHLMDYDMNEAKKHIDLRRDFPFVSHGTPAMDLKSILESVTEAEMPPWRYRIIHWDSALDAKEVKKVEKWVTESLKLLDTVK